MNRRLPAVLGILFTAPLLSFPPLPVTAAGAADPLFDVAGAAAYLRSQQQPDGGFETAGFPGFETPDAALALAEAAQTGTAWSTAEARAGVQAAVRDGKTALDYLDDLAETTTSGGQAAKLIVLVAAPLGYDPAAFNPQGDASADLVARMDAGRNANGSFGPPATFNATLYAAIAHALVGRSTPDATRAFIVDAQQANGGWNFAGDPKGDDVDIDTTGLAMQALAAAGVGASSDPVRRAVAFLSANQLPSGEWAAFDQPDPNATALAILGLTAAGRGVDSCWPGAEGSLGARQAADGHVAGPNDAFGVNTFATSQAVQAISRRWLPAVRARAYCQDDGYRLVAADGGVFAFGESRFFGSAGALRLNRPMVGMASTPGGQGYWLVAGDGGVFAFGDAAYFGSTGGLRLNQPVVGMAATPTGRGYWLVARDGGVFSFGDATFFGSTGSLTLNQPVVAITPTPTGGGYRLVAADGGVFAFGDADFLGSTAPLVLASPVAGAAGTPSGRGYWLTAGDGGVFAFGDARFLGSSASSTPSAAAQGVVGLRPRFRGDGYLTAAADGRTWSFSTSFATGPPPAPSRALVLNAPIVGVTG